MSDDKLKVIREAVSNAEDLPKMQHHAAEYSSPGGPGWGLPQGAPVIPLGIGANCLYFLDACGHFQEVEVSKLGRLKIIQLVGNSAWLYANFPQYGKGGQPTGWQHGRVSEVLVDACNALGSWSPAEKVRGAGGWRDKKGKLVLHCGNRLFIGRHERPTGLHEDMLYPARAPLPGPLFDGPADIGFRLLETLKSWNWARGEIDAKLVMGWIGAAMIGAAARWRPMIWFTGDAGTGKSLLQELIKTLLGNALLQSSDASRAGLFQTLHYDCLPISLDELEAEEDPRQQQAILQLATLSASGGVILRGGQNHAAMSFQARSAFSFSSILIPPLKAAILSRMAICELGPVTAKTQLYLEPFAQLGRQLLGRIAEQFDRYDATFNAYRTALMGVGHSDRAADQFGALGAAYDLMTRDGFDAGAAAAWARMLPKGNLAETASQTSDSQRCLDRLLTRSPQVFRGGKTETVAYWLQEAKREMVNGVDGDVAQTDASRVLASLGMRVVVHEATKHLPAKDRAYQVAVSNNHEGTASLFAGSHWQSVSGASGAWPQALRRVPLAVPGRMWIDGRTMRCTLLPWEECFQTEREMTAPEPEPYEPGAEG